MAEDLEGREELIRRTGQLAVPVTLIDDEVVLGVQPAPARRAARPGRLSRAGPEAHSGPAGSPPAALASFEGRRAGALRRAPHWGNLSRSFLRCCRATSTHSFSVAIVDAIPMYRSHCAMASRGSSFS